MAHTVYLKKQEKIKLGETKFSVTHLIPNLSVETRENKEKEVLNELYSIFKKYEKTP